MNPDHKPNPLFWVILFAVAMAFVEAMVVVYLRRIYYPDGFSFPLRPVELRIIGLEIAREAATFVMIGCAGVLAGRKFRERLAYAMVAFGVWDIAYYLWLKVAINWPHSLTDWDVLFLIPIPWIGPVIAPLFIAILMVVCGSWIALRFHRGLDFRLPRRSTLAVGLATGILIGSFIYDTGASLHFQEPKPYPYELLIFGLILYIAAFADGLHASRRT